MLIAEPEAALDRFVAAQNTDIVPGAETMAASDGGIAGADYGGGNEAHR